MFEDLGLKYVGPIDGHDEQAGGARRCAGPAISAARSSCTCLTRKGCGYRPAENDEEDQFHASAPFDPRRAPRSPPGRPGRRVFSDEMVADRRASATTWSRSPPPCCTRPAWRLRRGLPRPGLRRRHRRAARRDLRGRAGHGRTAPGRRGLRHVPEPRLRPGADGRGAAPAAGHVRARPGGRHRDDGASHNGMWDMSILQVVPGLRIAAPRDAMRLRRAAARGGGGRRRPDRGALPQGRGRRRAIAAVDKLGGMDVLRRPADGGEPRTCCWSRSARWRSTCLEAADRLADQGIGVTVVDPRWVKPLDEALVGAAAAHQRLVHRLHPSAGQSSGRLCVRRRTAVSRQSPSGQHRPAARPRLGRAVRWRPIPPSLPTACRLAANLGIGPRSGRRPPPPPRSAARRARMASRGAAISRPGITCRIDPSHIPLWLAPSPPGHPGPVQRERDRQPVQRHVHQQLVEGPVQERRVDRDSC